VPKRSVNHGSTISWERARAIFGHADSPAEVWESQFDYCDDDLKRLAATPYRKIDRADLWYYFHDLAYVPLQPDLFNYLFPVCLMEWHHSLLNNEPCAQGDAEFHYALVRGNVLEGMLSAHQREEVYGFFRDSFLERLDAERGFVRAGSPTPAFGWMLRFNCLGLVVPCIEMFWKPWWQVETPGRAVCTLQYCSGLIYFEGENPIFDPWTAEHGGGGPYLAENNSFLFDAGLQPPNLEFLKRTLTAPYVLQKVQQAADRLDNEPERELARKISSDAATKREMIETMIAELFRLLETGRDSGI
jgi:hypothetical protein